jgi:hypothetical protein
MFSTGGKRTSRERLLDELNYVRRGTILEERLATIRPPWCEHPTPAQAHSMRHLPQRLEPGRHETTKYRTLTGASGQPVRVRTRYSAQMPPRRASLCASCSFNSLNAIASVQTAFVRCAVAPGFCVMNAGPASSAGWPRRDVPRGDSAAGLRIQNESTFWTAEHRCGLLQ